MLEPHEPFPWIAVIAGIFIGVWLAWLSTQIW